MDTSGGVLARALNDYQANGPGELVMKSGDMVGLRWRLDENWFYGDIKGIGGLVPVSAVQVLGEQSQPVPLCRALYDFDLNKLDPEERKECLGFQKGDVLTVIKQIDENWGEGKLGDKIGIFPLHFTEPNPAALKLLARAKGSDCAEIRPRNLRGSSVRADINADTQRRISRTPTSTIRPPDVSVLNNLNHGHRSQSSVALSTPGKPVRLPSTFKLRAGSTRRSLVKVERKMNAEDPSSVTMALINPQAPPLLLEGKQASFQQLSISVCAALYSYTPHRPEELELSKGEMVGVYGKFKEGWLRGLSLRTGKVGILPANYVTPVLRTSARFLEQPKSVVSSVSTVPAKRYTAHNPQLALDKVKGEGTSAAPVGTMPSQPALSSACVVRAPQTGGKQGWDTVRRAFQTSHRGSHHRTQSLHLPAHDLGQIYGVGRSPVLPRKRNGLFTNPIKSQQRTCDRMTPDGAYHTLDSKYLPPKDAFPAPQSILVKPDPHRQNTEKPFKSVRFSTEDASQLTSKMMPLSPGMSPGTQITSNPQSPPMALEHWNPSAIIGRDGSTSVLKDTKMILQRKGPGLKNGFLDSLPLGLKPPAINNQSSPVRHRVLLGYNARTDAELNLLEGELVLVQKPRPDGRVLVTQEITGITGIFQSSILNILDKTV